MFDPKVIFPLVRKSVTKGSDQDVMTALTKLAQAHPDLTAIQALAALQKFTLQKAPSNKAKTYLEGQ